MAISSIVIEVIRAVLIFVFFYERYFKCKKHKQKHLSNIQPDISKEKKHLSNIHSNKYVLKYLKNASMKHLEQKLLVTPSTNYFYA